tara:strand:- start:115594 stop:116364 length:771 start_codon:yes stop_codon:yes gene_type:complete
MDSFLNKIVDKIYVLYVSNDEKEIFKSNNTTLQYDFFKGVYGKNLKEEFDIYNKTSQIIPKTHKYYTELKKYFDWYFSIVKTKKRISTLGQLGHIKSHIKIIKDAIQNNYETILLLEPDVAFHKNFNNIDIKNYEKLIKNNSIIYLGASQHEWINPFSRKKVILNKKENYYNCEHTTGTFAVLLKKEVFEDYLSILELKYMPSDIALTFIQNNYNCIVLYPNLIISDVRTSKISTPRNLEKMAKKFKWNMNLYLIK